MKLAPKPSRLVAYAAALALVSVTAYATSIPASAEWNPTTLENTVATQEEKLNNHEVRITAIEAQTASNTESIERVQTNLEGLAAAATPGQMVQSLNDVQTASTPAPTPEPTPAVTITGQEKGYAYLLGDVHIKGEPYNFSTELPNNGGIPCTRTTYSDGSSKLLRADGTEIN